MFGGNVRAMNQILTIKFLFMKKMTLTTIILLMVIFTNLNLKAQTIEEDKSKLYFGVGGGIGFVNPKEINKTIENYYGTEANIHIDFNIELNLGYYISEEIEIKGALIAAAAFSQVEDKDMIGMSNNKVNFLTRLAPEIIGNYYFDLNQPSLFYAGGGFSYNKLALYIDSDDISSSGKAFGFVINIGLLPQKRKNQTYLELKANIIKDKYDYLNFSGFNLNYGVRF
jgi:hypothetical protein